MRRQLGCAAAAAGALAATVLPWSSTAAAGRSGWGTASLALALDEAVQLRLLTVFACVWYVVPLGAAGALVLCWALPRRWAAAALRSVGVLLVVVVLAVVACLLAASWHVSLLGPLLALAGGAAMVALPPRALPQPRTRQDGAARTGALP